jgi:hypothetical protein
VDDIVQFESGLFGQVPAAGRHPELDHGTAALDMDRRGLYGRQAVFQERMRRLREEELADRPLLSRPLSVWISDQRERHSRDETPSRDRPWRAAIGSSEEPVGRAGRW